MKNLICCMALVGCLLPGFQAKAVQCDNDGLLREAWVYFNSKDAAGFDPYTFFDPKAIERRLRHGICLYNPDDLPVNDQFIRLVGQVADSVVLASRWLNAVNVYVHPDQLADLHALSFVDTVQLTDRQPGMILAGYPSALQRLAGMHDIASNPGLSEDRIELMTPFDPDKIEIQTGHLGGSHFHERGFDGSGIRVAVFDAGFPGVDTHPVFSHLHTNDRIKATWDFHRNRPNVYRYNAHGTMVLSMIAGMVDTLAMGLATGAEFLLARTEIWREPLAEEKYWLAAAEWADQLGADIINSSLGYYRHRYFPEDMDGQTSLVAMAAQMAARKGILVVNSAGNEGTTSDWRIIITPADVDSVLTVGAVGYPSMLKTAYSSPGPTADKRMKPNVAALGDVLVAGRRGFRKTQGTSFSSPLVTGFAACLLQMYPTMNNMQVFDAIQRSATLYPYFDYAHGYGVPQAGYFFSQYHVVPAPTFDMSIDHNRLKVIIRQSPESSPGDVHSERYLFYHIREPDGFVSQYYVIKVERQQVLSVDINTFEPGQQIFVFYDGFVSSHSF